MAIPPARPLGQNVAMSFWKRLFGAGKGSPARYQKRVAEMTALEAGLRDLPDEDLRRRSEDLRDKARAGTPLDDLAIPAGALVREAGRRTLGMRHFDVQLIGGLALHDGCVAEMKTGEGKTLVATFPAYLNALSGRGVHVVTVNDYLAQRDAEWMGPLYRLLGLTVGVIREEMGDDEAEERRARREAYACDITYGTNHEIAFDYLRDNLAIESADVVQRGFQYAIVDEVDFLLIDEARTPLIISGPSREDTDVVRRVDGVVRKLESGLHYVAEPKTRTVGLTEAGFVAVEAGLGVSDLAEPGELDLFHAVHQSVLAHGLYRRDVDYLVEDNEVRIIDEFTGRVSEDKRYADGLHQAIEAKERVRVRGEDQTLAKVTYQTFFARYEKLAGMTGTAVSAKAELASTYELTVVVVPTHRPMIRRDMGDLLFDTTEEKHAAVAKAIAELRAQGRPVLVGSTSVRESEQLSRVLKRAKIPHDVLNAKNHRAEAAIIAQAGQRAGVTISTNMAGRGVDILLGGAPGKRPPEEIALAHEAVAKAGGLHVIGTGHHESERIDHQLRGRAGRQGDPGSSQFFLSLDDDLYEKFGQEEIAALREELEEQEHPADTPIADANVLKLLRELQRKVEEEDAATRRDVLRFDLVVNAQRETIYAWRRTLVTGEGFDPEAIIRETIADLCARAPGPAELAEALRAQFHAPFELDGSEDKDLEERARGQALALLRQREEMAGRAALHKLGRRLLLETIDDLWTEHLSILEKVEEGMGLRGYAEEDPLVAWKKETAAMWDELLRLIRSHALKLWFLADVSRAPAQQRRRRGSRRER
jgi:preprotein translocase subunit SecA